ncbi:MAG: hypothetical protein DRP09_17545 [Candidatus Thorarchaeota archaeon]|nr:MAG: hypothetical protein DRP09_17545 [Candidatus Thorarchaeota archaeon]
MQRQFPFRLRERSLVPRETFAETLVFTVFQAYLEEGVFKDHHLDPIIHLSISECYGSPVKEREFMNIATWIWGKMFPKIPFPLDANPTNIREKVSEAIMNNLSMVTDEARFMQESEKKELVSTLAKKYLLQVCFTFLRRLGKIR